MKYGEAVSYFSCDMNKLKNLNGAPNIVYGSFNCTNNPDLPIEEIIKYFINDNMCHKIFTDFLKFDFLKFNKSSEKDKIRIIYQL